MTVLTIWNWFFYLIRKTDVADIIAFKWNSNHIHMVGYKGIFIKIVFEGKILHCTPPTFRFDQQRAKKKTKIHYRLHIFSLERNTPQMEVVQWPPLIISHFLPTISINNYILHRQSKVAYPTICDSFSMVSRHTLDT